MERILAKYTQAFTKHRPLTGASSPSGFVFLVTGTTGGLGTNLLAQLLGSPDVEKVYALNRPGSSETTLLRRHKEAFVDRGVDPSLLDSDKFVLIEGDTTREDLGIDKDVYAEVRPCPSFG